VPVVLKADVAGAEVLGQVNVQTAAGLISAVSIVPPDAPTSDEVVDAVSAADQIVIGPGSLFTSVLATCVVPAIREALLARDAGRVYVCNLRPQLPETAGFSPADILRAVTAHGVPVDVMVVDGGCPPPDRLPDPTRLVTAPLARPDRAAHDPALLGAVLAGLAAGT
jgi:uncharacterized cofD-like protein